MNKKKILSVLLSAIGILLLGYIFGIPLFTWLTNGRIVVDSFGDSMPIQTAYNGNFIIYMRITATNNLQLTIIGVAFFSLGAIPYLVKWLVEWCAHIWRIWKLGDKR